MNIIVYSKPDGLIVLLSPAPLIESVTGITAIAEKDVPQDFPYWLVTDSDIPSDRSQRNAWQIDETIGDPDGFGGASNEFTDEQLLQLYNAGVIG